jgi:O-antigen ligase
MAIGVYYILNPQDKATYLNWVFRILVSIVCFFVVIRTGSRSGLLCYATAVALTLFFQFLAYGKTQKRKITKRFLIMLLLVLTGLFLFDYINNIESGTTGIHRLLNEFRLDAYSGRTSLYVEAWEFFKKNPVFGIGYKCFVYLSSFDYFTHTTYMELLSCTGLVGFSLFLYPCVPAVASAWKHRKKDLGRSFTILMVFAAVGLFGIVYYNLLFMVVLYCEIVRARTLGAGEKCG